MTCGRLTKKAQQHLTTTTTTVAHEAFTEWMPCEGIANVRAILKNKAVITAGNSLKTTLAFQTAKVRTDDPDPWTDFTSAGASLTTATASSGETNTTSDLSTVYTNTTANSFWIRFGVGYQNSGSAVLANGDVEAQFSFLQCGRVVGTHTFRGTVMHLNTLQNEPITPWLLGIEVADVKAAIYAQSQITGTTTITYQLVYQTAASTTDSANSSYGPGAWTTVGSSTTLDAVAVFNVEECKADTAVSTTDMWIRFGLQFVATNLPTSNATSEAIFTTAVAVK